MASSRGRESGRRSSPGESASIVPPPSPAVAWLAGQPGRWELSVVVTPGAPRDGVDGEHDGRLRLRIAAPPIDGRANRELQRFVAERLGVPRAVVSIAQGEGSRRKRVRIEAPLSADEIVARLAR